MKKALAILLFASLCGFTSGAQKATQNKMEQFKHHFSILDAIAKETSSDTLLNCIASIQFMEKHTGIEASSDGTYIGKLTCTKSDLQKWHDWYRKKYGKKE
jgi:hypothetical protein